MGSGLVVLTLKLYRQLVLVSDSFVLDLYICCDFHPNHFLNFPKLLCFIIRAEGCSYHFGYYKTTFIIPPFLDIKSLMRLGNGIRFVTMTFLVIHIMVTLTLLLLIVFS